MSNMFNAVVIIIILGLVTNISVAASGGQGMVTFRGSSDSSAAFMVDDSRFVVADDENNILRVYDIDKVGMPVQTINSLQEFLAGDKDSEADIEGSAVAGDTVYWIGSHGRNKNGKLRSARQVFCGAEVDSSDSGGVKLDFIGSPYNRLLHDLVISSIGRKLNLAKVVRFDDPSKKSLAPKKDGINIEGMAAAADGTLYIGFRNPLFDDKALIVRLTNPRQVLLSGDSCKFEGPILLDLDKRGIRSLEYDSAAGVCYIVAGEKGSENNFSVFRWDGDGKSKPAEIIKIRPELNFNPEAMFIHGNKLYLLSDDGGMPVKVKSVAECMPGEMLAGGMCPNKFLVDQGAKTFRLKVFDVSVCEER